MPTTHEFPEGKLVENHPSKDYWTAYAPDGTFLGSYYGLRAKAQAKFALLTHRTHSNQASP